MRYDRIMINNNYKSDRYADFIENLYTSVPMNKDIQKMRPRSNGVS